ncbi:RNA polymerase subunit sigma-70, partial [Amycolatopsis japonica]
MTDTRNVPTWLSQASDAFNDSLSRSLDLDKALAQVKSRALTHQLIAAGQTSPVSKVTSRSDVESIPVAAAVEGDPQAVERLLAAIRPLVVRYCRARVGRQ